MPTFKVEFTVSRNVVVYCTRDELPKVLQDEELLASSDPGADDDSAGLLTVISVKDERGAEIVVPEYFTVKYLEKYEVYPDCSSEELRELLQNPSKLLSHDTAGMVNFTIVSVCGKDGPLFN